MPWTAERFILDPDVHKTMREQDLFLFEKMLELTDLIKQPDFVAIDEDPNVSCGKGRGG